MDGATGEKKRETDTATDTPPKVQLRDARDALRMRERGETRGAN